MTKVELARPRRVYITHTEYVDMLVRKHGICFACGSVYASGVGLLEKPCSTCTESDAEAYGHAGGYRCQRCRQQAVVGAVQAAIEGWLKVDDEKVQARTPS